MTSYNAKNLIREIKVRPGIYNKQKLQHPKRENKHRLWLEVAECLTPNSRWQQYTKQEKEAAINEVRLKWKHLRDQYYRDIKLQLAGKSQEKRKYIHFDEMEFMRPFVGYKMKPVSSCDNQLKQTSGYNSTSPQLLLDIKKDEREENCHQIVASIVEGEKSIEIDSNSNNKDLPASKSQISSTANKPSTQSNLQIRDPDISFCLSLVPTLRKLSESQKLLTKIEILKVLHRIVAKQQATERNNNKNANISVRNSIEIDHEDPLNINVKDVGIDVDVDCDNNEGEIHSKAWWT